MSSSSCVREKMRGGAGGKIMASKPEKTLTENRQKDTLGSCRLPAGEENPWLSGAGTPSIRQKPEIGSMPMQWGEMPALVPEKDGKLHFRQSTATSVPEGMNSKDFYRFLLNLPKVSASDRPLGILGRAPVAGMEISVGTTDENDFRFLGNSHMKRSVSCSNLKGLDMKVVDRSTGAENCDVLGLDLKEMVRDGFSVLEDCTVHLFLVSDSEENGLKCLSRIDASESNSKGLCERDVHVVNSMGSGKLDLDLHSHCEENAYLDLDSQESGANAVNDLGIEENSVGAVPTDSNSIEKDEKACDGSGVSESKDVSEIEKAMGHAVDHSNCKPGSCATVETDELQNAHEENCLDAIAGSLRNSVTSMNHGESEAAPFPHQKLWGSQVSFGNPGTIDQSLKLNVLEAFGDSVPEEGLLSPIDENLIVLESLNLLDREHSQVKNKHDQSECAAIQEMDADRSSKPEEEEVSKKVVSGMGDGDVVLTADENLDDFDDQENKSSTILKDPKETSSDQLREIGRKSCTGGWFVSRDEFVLLAHEDSTCSFYDVANLEEKSVYNPPAGVSANLWGDCWLIRAADSDGCSGSYVVAASAGSTSQSGFCSWDFYTKGIRAFRVEDSTASTSRAAIGPLHTEAEHKGDTSSTNMTPGNQQWWYEPSGPLIASAACCQKVVSIFDIRDGDQIVKWEVQMPILAMDYSSPLQWRNNQQLVIAETEAMKLWDVNSLHPQSLRSIGKKVSALHVNNTEADLGGGVRWRGNLSEAKGNDGVFCTPESINVLDFRLSSGVGLTILKQGVNSHCISSHGDFIFVGSTYARKPPRSLVQQFSLRMAKLFGTYALPESKSLLHNSSITQVWGDLNLVMAICGQGLFVFDAFKNDAHPIAIYRGTARQARKVIGPDDLYCPSFDYSGSRVLLISRDRPAHWKYLP